MIAKKCDRCGSFYDASDATEREVKLIESKVNRRIRMSHIDLPAATQTAPPLTIDLCPKCRDDLLAWLSTDRLQILN